MSIAGGAKTGGAARDHAGLGVARRLHHVASMKTFELPTTDLSTVTGGCAACGNPGHIQAPRAWTQQAAQWGAQAGQKVASWLRR